MDLKKIEIALLAAGFAKDSMLSDEARLVLETFELIKVCEIIRGLDGVVGNKPFGFFLFNNMFTVVADRYHGTKVAISQQF